LTNIYIIRHGETDSNIRHTCLGQKDVPLNENGRQQAQELADKLADVKLDAVYSSPLDRAVNTFAPASRGRGVTMSFALIERDFGVWDDMTFDEIREKDPGEFEKWQKDYVGYQIKDGESSEQVQARVNAFTDKLLKNHSGQTIAVVTHLGTARHLISRLLGLTTEQSWRFTLDTGKFALISVDDEGKGLLKALNV